MKMLVALLLVACSKKEEPADKLDLDQIKDEASVEFARKQVAELDTALASQDPGSASSICAVIKGDLPAIRKADKKLAETIEKRCGRDLGMRSLTVFVEKIETAVAKGDRLMGECRSWDIYTKRLKEAGLDGDPEVTALRARFDQACASAK